MKRHLLAVLLPAFVAGAPGALVAEEPAESRDRAADVIAAIESLSEKELKQFYLRCSRAAVRGMLSGGEIALCSIGYERLLKRSFGGDFHALLEWRRDPYGEKEKARPSPF